MEVLAVTEIPEQRLEATGVFHGERDVVAGVRAELIERFGGVVAVNARVNGHDQAVLHRHPRELVGHVGLERVGLIHGGFAAQAEGWTWTIWMLLWLGGFTLIFLTFLLPETSAATYVSSSATRE